MAGQYKADSQPDFDPGDLTYDQAEEILPDQDDWPEDEPLPDNPLAFSDEHMARLGLTLDFGPGDLASNRDGDLSPAQIVRLERDLRLFYWPMIVALVLFAFITGVMGAIYELGMLIPALVLMALAAIPAVLLNRERAHLPDRTVTYTTLRLGGFSLTIRRWGFKDDQRLPVDGSKPVFGPKSIYKVLQANQTYLAYYAPVRTWRGYRLLSLEPMEGARVFRKPKRKPKRGF
jgi:hypothetical protein